MSAQRSKTLVYRSVFHLLISTNATIDDGFTLIAAREIVNAMTNDERIAFAEKVSKEVSVQKKRQVKKGASHDDLPTAIIQTILEVQGGRDSVTMHQEADSKRIEQTAAHKKIKQPSAIQPAAGDEWFITNSGLVLLQPFLGSLFTNTGYIENNEWMNDEVQQRAVALTQYLMTGRDEFPEFDLLLNKLMCNYAFEKTLPFDLVLSDYEKGEADDLLQSVVKHWTALKNTSVEGLRNTFFLRNGKLVKDESGWLLQVEQKTVDILLNKLPWGFSMVKLPWMADLLRVEWNY